MATTINAGRVAMVPKGTWSSVTEYVRLDVVLHDGSSYVAIQDSTNKNPSSEVTYWQLLAGGVDSSNYYTKTETNTKLAAKQDALVSGTNIKTINSTSVLGSGNIDTQEIYVIPSAYILQIQTAAGTGENTPTLSTAYADIYNAIRGGKQLVCDLSETDAAPKRYVATECYAANTQVAFTFAPFDTEGSVFKRYQIHTNNNRSIYVASVEEFKGDSAPTASSSNYVTSGGIKTALDTKQDTLVSGTNIKTVNSTSLLGSGNISTKEILTLNNDLPSVGTVVNSDDYTLIESAATNGMLVQGSGVVYYLYSSIIGTPPNSYAAIWAIKFIAPTDAMNIGFSMVGYAIRTSDHVVTKIENFNANAKADKVVTASSIPSGGALPNVCYNLGTTDSVTITLAAGESGVANIWMFTFTAQTTACSVTLPQGVSLANEYAWDMAAGRRFEVSIMDGVAAVIYSD